MQRRTLALGAVVLAGGALVLFCCTGGGQRPAGTPASGDASASAPPVALLTDDAGTPPGEAPRPSASSATVAPTASLSPAASGTPPAVGPGARIADAVKSADPRDLQLLATIERELRRDPPPEVHAVLAQRKRGASRTELTRAIQALGDLQVRVLMFRWLDYVMPVSDAGTIP
jgi:hypothetical protein